MSAATTTVVYGLLGKVESSYGAATTLSDSADGILLAQESVLTRTPLHDGNRAMQSGSYGPGKRVAPSGFQGSLPYLIEMRGAGTAYGASVFPPDIHTILRASGHGVTTVTTSEAETQTYAPVRSSFASAAFECYARGRKLPLTKAYADFGFDIEAGGLAMATGTIDGIPGTVTTTAVPDITYNATMPPKAESVAFSLNPNAAGAITTLVVRRISFRQNRARGARADMNTTGHAGFHPGRFNPTLEVTIEDPLLATVNLFSNYGSGHTNAISFTVGSVQYNKFTFSADYAQLTQDPAYGEDGEGVGLVTLTYQLSGSTQNSVDHYSLLFD